MAEGETASGSSPFTDADFDHLLEDEKADSAESGWSRVKENDSGEVWRKVVQGVDAHLVKGLLKFPGVPHEDVAILLGREMRPRWDDKLMAYDLLEEFDNYTINQVSLKVPSPCSNRDLVQAETVRRDEDKIMIVMKNATHEKAPVRKNFVRAELFPSSFIIRPDESNPGSSKMTVLAQFDMKGVLPKFVVNHFAVDGPLVLRDSLLKFHKETYLKEKAAGKES
jgi:hypothetical protein